jgi:6-phosphogluconolactonase
MNGGGFPGLRGDQRVLDSPAQAGALLAEHLAEQIRLALSAHAHAHLALSGGSSASLLGAALMKRSPLAADAWARVHVWLVDERCVPDNDQRLNANLLRSLLVTPGLIPAANLHPMPVLRPEGPVEYESALRAAFAARPDPKAQRLDAIVLGMGTDGHTASLFPHTSALDEKQRWIVFNDGDKVVAPRPRMTMTFPLINQAAFIGVLATGEEKHPALTAAAANPDDFHARPVAGVTPGTESTLVWFFDRAACIGPAGGP